MNPTRVDQLVAGFADGDAISKEARAFRDAFRQLGMTSDIYAPGETVSPIVADECRPIEDYDSTADNALVFHYSIASPATAVFHAAKARTIVRYHNITPDAFFAPYDDDVAAQLRRARAELQTVAATADATWTDSDYNAQELRQAGCKGVVVLPLMYELADLLVEPRPATLQRFSGQLTNILSVGRIAPNKCLEELIRAFAWYHRGINPRSRLILIGSERSCPRYFAMLKALATRLGLLNVCFEGFRADDELAAYYRRADVFVSASRHEGYCLPLVEAMQAGALVVARATGGMPETLRDSGVLYDDLTAPQLAQLIDRVASPGPLRDEVLASQQRRLGEIAARDGVAELKALLAAL